MLFTTEPARSSRPLDEAIRAIPATWFRPSPAVYWTDLAASAGIGWAAFATGAAATGWRHILLLAVAMFSLYRAVLFIHEITHVSRRDLPAFRAVWNALVGVPLLIPSFLYENVHTDHHVVRTWFVVGAAVSAVNAVRTLAAHRYDRDDGEVSMTGQLLDSCTIAPASRRSHRLLHFVADAGRALVAPVGLRYHALHHWIPSLPYHNLGRAHRLLIESLRPDAPYRTTLERGIVPILTDLIRRARSHSRAAAARRPSRFTR